MNLEQHGPQIDIHGGGFDVLFPHHENEIAQSESYTGRVPFARYWVHNALLHLPGQEKMTRHLGGLIYIPDALSRHSADAIRVFVLSTHYRSPLTWTEEGVEAAERGLERLRAAVKDLPDLPLPPRDASDTAHALGTVATQVRARFIAAMDDDLNAAGALGALHDLAREINRARAEGVALQDLTSAQRMLKELAGVLGLTLKEWTRPITAEETQKIQALIQERNALRAAKRYAEADRIRAQLAEMGVALEDSPQGTTWKKIR